jgi:hypothetical protein
MIRARAHSLVALCASILVVAACQAASTPGRSSSGASVPLGDSATATTPVATGPATAKASLMAPAGLVLMGDSVLLHAKPIIWRQFQEELGLDLRVRDWINPDLATYEASGLIGGERSTDLLQRLRTDEQLRQDVREAAVIVFDVPFGALNDACPDPSIGAGDLEACFAAVVPGYQADVDAIFEELVALRDPSEAIIRATDVWQFFWPTFHEAGTYGVAQRAWLAMNRAVTDAAAQHGIPMVHAYDLLTGPDGDRDPVAAGDVQWDEIHLTPQGAERFVDALAALGFEAR